MGSLSQTQRSLIIGSLLGDGYVRIMKGRSNAFLEINHTAKAKAYVDWKHTILKNIVSSPPHTRNGNGNRIAYRFYTRQHPEITDLYRMFYQERKKIIPNIPIDPLILAVWYMDDGSKCGTSNYYLNTQQFNLTDQEKLLGYLGKFGLTATLNRDKIYWRIRLLMSCVDRFKTIVRPFIIPSMEYKIT